MTRALEVQVRDGGACVVAARVAGRRDGVVKATPASRWWCSNSGPPFSNLDSVISVLSAFSTIKFVALVLFSYGGAVLF